MDPKDKKLLFIVTIPLLIFVSIIVGFFYLMLTGWAILIIGAISLGTFGRTNGLRRLTRGLVIITLLIIAFYPNVTEWPSQFARRMPGGRNALIEPDHPKFPELNDTLNAWHLDRYGYSFTALDDLETEVDRVDSFIRWNVTEYEYDMFSPYLMIDHLPTVSQIFASDFDGNGRLEDDCDGQTILTASFLIFLGYEQVFISEIDFHWHTLVFPSHVNPLTADGYDEVIFLYSYPPLQSFYIFNQTHTFIPPVRNLGESLWDIIKSDYIIDYLGYIVLSGGYIGFELPWFLWIPIFIIVGLVLSLFFLLLLSMFHMGVVRGRKKSLKTLLFASLTIASFLGVLVLFYFLEREVDYFIDLDAFQLEWLGNIVLFTGIGLNLRILDSGIIYRKKNHDRIKENDKEMEISNK